jgi:hypothetical protein
MKKFMQNYVGKGIQLFIQEKEDKFQVHTIEIMQKVDETCPVKDLEIGEYFLHLVAINPKGSEASIVCNWNDDLLKSLMTNYKEAKDAQYSQVTMFHDPLSDDPNKWMLTWGNELLEPKPDPIPYIS